MISEYIWFQYFLITKKKQLQPHMSISHLFLTFFFSSLLTTVISHTRFLSFFPLFHSLFLTANNPLILPLLLLPTLSCSLSFCFLLSHSLFLSASYSLLLSFFLLPTLSFSLSYCFLLSHSLFLTASNPLILPF